MQSDIIPFQRLDPVAAEHRTDTFGDIGCGGGCSSFQPFGLYFLFHTVQFLPCRRFLFLQFLYVGFQNIRHYFHFAVKLLGGNMFCFRSVDAASQSVFSHRFGIGSLVGFEFVPCHHIVGA